MFTKTHQAAALCLSSGGGPFTPSLWLDKRTSPGLQAAGHRNLCQRQRLSGFPIGLSLYKLKQCLCADRKRFPNDISIQLTGKV